MTAEATTRAKLVNGMRKTNLLTMFGINETIRSPHTVFAFFKSRKPTLVQTSQMSWSLALTTR